jgi:hypothetical protein
MKAIRFLIMAVMLVMITGCKTGGGWRYAIPFYHAPTPGHIGSPPVYRPGAVGSFF